MGDQLSCRQRSCAYHLEETPSLNTDNAHPGMSRTSSQPKDFLPQQECLSLHGHEQPTLQHMV